MIQLTKKILFNALGLERYLRLVSKVYLRLYKAGALKKKYPEAYFVMRLVNAGDSVIDIGANLGYYSVPLSKACGAKGKVLSVEPFPLFVAVLRENLKASGHGGNVTVLPYALSDAERGATLKMGVPLENGVLRHGLTKVIAGDFKAEDFHKVYEVPMQSPQKLFGDLAQLNYIKCDVEGHEAHIIPQMRETIAKHLPIIQIELYEPEGRKVIWRLLQKMHYRAYGLRAGRLHHLPDVENAQPDGDYYFIPESKRKQVEHLIAKSA